MPSVSLVVDTGDKFAIGVNDTGGNVASVNDTGGNLPPVETISATN